MTAALVALMLGACTSDTVASSPDTSAAADASDSSADVAVAACEGPAPLAWPTKINDPPPCAEKAAGLALPAGVTAIETGGIRLRPSGYMQPIGELEKVAIEVLAKNGGVDETFTGKMRLQTTTDTQLTAGTPVGGLGSVVQIGILQGRAVVGVKQLAAGKGSIKASLVDDPRTGSVTLFGYSSKLPIWRIAIDDKDWQELIANPKKRIFKKIILEAEGDKFSASIRLHGGSSRLYPKKSLRVNLSGAALADGTRQVVLRAEWRDKTMLRLYLGFAVLRELTTLPASDVSFVHLRRTDGTFIGLMARTERIDGRYLQKRGYDPDGHLFEADPPFELAVPGGNLTPVSLPEAYTMIYQRHGGDGGYTSLIELIEQTLQLPEMAFIQTLPDAVKLEHLQAYIAVMAAIQNHDHVKKNYYLYRDDKGPDCRWEMLAWDLDLSFGHTWTPEEQLLGETIHTDGDPLAGRYIGNLFFNRLIDRVVQHPPWRKGVAAALTKLLQGFTEEFVQRRIDDVVCRVRQDLLADRNKRASNGELTTRIGELKQYVKGRRAFLAKWSKSL